MNHYSSYTESSVHNSAYQDSNAHSTLHQRNSYSNSNKPSYYSNYMMLLPTLSTKRTMFDFTDIKISIKGSSNNNNNSNNKDDSSGHDNNHDNDHDDEHPLIHNSNPEIVLEMETIPETNRFFVKNTWQYRFFSNDYEGRAFRIKVTIVWGIISMALVMTILKLVFKYNLAVCFFVGATTLTTIGYGPVLTPKSIPDHNFLSVYFILCVLPFTILQVLVGNDVSALYSHHIHQLIGKRLHKGLHPSKTFNHVFGIIVLSQSSILVSLIILGALLYKYFALEDYWVDAVFYSIASAISVGYGSIDMEDSEGCYVIGCYALICHYVVFMIIIPKIVALWIVASDNIDRYKFEDSSMKSILVSPITEKEIPSSKPRVV